MDIRVYLAGGKEKRCEKNTEKIHKRPNEEGKVPQSKRKFLPSWKTDLGFTIEMGQCSARCVRKDAIYHIPPQQRGQFLGVMADSATDVGVQEVEDVCFI